MKLAITTWGQEGRYLYDLINKYGSDKYEICWVAEEDSDLWGLLPAEDCRKSVRIGSFGKAVALYNEGKIERFLIPSLMEDPNKWSVAERLQENNLHEEAMLYAPVEIFKDEKMSPEEKIGLICKYSDKNELDFMEIHVADHCNLNCKNCSMFSGLVKKPVFSDYQKTAAGIEQLKKFFNHIKVFRILGGEPLLNPELDKYIELVRNIFPYTDIRIITNGILVRRMNQKLIDSLKQNDASIYVTCYPALVKTIDDIHDFFHDRAIKHSISYTITNFRKIYNAQGTSNSVLTFKQCTWKGCCANLKEGKISACFTPFVIHYLAENFALKINDSGTIDLFEEGLTINKIMERLKTPFDLCRYCAPNGIITRWELMDEHSMNCIGDWSV